MKTNFFRKVFPLCLWIAVLFAAAAVASGQNPCRQIAQACRDAGFVQGAARQGNGVMADCVRPILQGQTPPEGGKPLPQMDPQVVAACKQRNPNFGGAGAQDSGSQPPPLPPLPSPAAHPAKAGAPNIIFILTDDLAINLVQYMPHVLQMQKEGVTFKNYFVTDSLCCPSRSSIFTGRYPHDTGVFKNVGVDGGYLVFKSRGNEQATFAVALAAAGYRTAFMGKYLNGYQPQQHSQGPGWNRWVVAGNGYPEFNYAFNQDGQIVRHGNAPADYLTDVVSDLGVKFIKEQKGTPFFIEIATFAPHGPYTPAPRDADAFLGLKAPRTSAYNAPVSSSGPKWLVGHPALTQGDMDRIDTAFRKRAQAVQAVDKMIGALMAAVREIGQEKNTYFLFSSDNGYHMGEFRLLPGKMTAYDTDIRVPLIVTGPGVPAGRTLDEIAENVDLNPTFIELAGADLFPNVDGMSLVSLIHGHKSGDWRSAALIEHHGPARDPSDPDFPGRRSGNPPTYEAIRLANAVYVEYADGDKEYHDLASDPDELKNTYSSLSDEQKAWLHQVLTATQNCHDAKACKEAQRGNMPK